MYLYFSICLYEGRGRLDIVCMPGPSVFLLPHMVADFALEKPDMECSLISRSSAAVFQLVAAQQYDLGLADHAVGKVDSTSLVSERVFHFTCICAIPKGDPLAAKRVIKPQDLDGKPLATLYEGHEIHTNTRHVFTDTGCRLNIKFTTQYFIPLLTYVEKRVAYAIVDPIAVESYRLSRGDDAGLVFRPFKPVVGYRVSMLTPDYRPASRLMQSFRQTLVTRLASLGGLPGK
ncbi:MAG: LysR substrate-binding domain-containing protein [Pseudomonadota bacterium]